MLLQILLVAILAGLSTAKPKPYIGTGCIPRRCDGIGCVNPCPPPPCQVSNQQCLNPWIGSHPTFGGLPLSTSTATLGTQPTSSFAFPSSLYGQSTLPQQSYSSSFQSYPSTSGLTSTSFDTSALQYAGSYQQPSSFALQNTLDLGGSSSLLGQSTLQQPSTYGQGGYSFGDLGTSVQTLQLPASTSFAQQPLNSLNLGGFSTAGQTVQLPSTFGQQTYNFASDLGTSAQYPLQAGHTQGYSLSAQDISALSANSGFGSLGTQSYAPQYSWGQTGGLSGISGQSVPSNLPAVGTSWTSSGYQPQPQLGFGHQSGLAHQQHSGNFGVIPSTTSISGQAQHGSVLGHAGG